MLDNMNERAAKTLAALRDNLAKIRSGRAHAGLLDGVSVNCYGADMPLAHIATVTIADARTLLVAVWDRQNAAAAEKAIRDSDLGVNPAAAGQNIRVPLPPLSEERRRDLVKLVGKEAEDARIAVRNIRRDVLAGLKNAVKEKSIGEDDAKRQEQEAQKITDKTIRDIETLVAEKRDELMTV